jgi:hypothetical protein
MLIIIILIAIAVLLPVVVFLLRGRGSYVRVSPAELTARLRPVDIEAFCNLVDPDEESFLRSNLPPGLFRSVQRERLLAATEYVGAASHNAIILTKLAEVARNHADTSSVQAARELTNTAVRLRLHCLLVTINLWTAIVLPGAGLSSGTFVEEYQQLNGLARRLARLSHHSTPSEAAAS